MQNTSFEMQASQKLANFYELKMAETNKSFFLIMYLCQFNSQASITKLQRTDKKFFPPLHTNPKLLYHDSYPILMEYPHWKT